MKRFLVVELVNVNIVENYLSKVKPNHLTIVTDIVATRKMPFVLRNVLIAGAIFLLPQMIEIKSDVQFVKKYIENIINMSCI